MTWHCQTCTYCNINDRASRCHTCGTDRPAGDAAAHPAIVDLTGFSSPKPPPKKRSAASKNCHQRADGENFAAGDGASSHQFRGGDVMESNRSRRRRRMKETSSRIREDTDKQIVSSNNESASVGTHDDALRPGQHDKARADHSNTEFSKNNGSHNTKQNKRAYDETAGYSQISKKQTNKPSSSNVNSPALFESGSSHTSIQSKRSGTSYERSNRTSRRNASADESDPHRTSKKSKRSGPANERSARVVNGSGGKRSERDGDDDDDDDDTILDPAPRKKIPSNITGRDNNQDNKNTSHKPKNGRGESKLKKRRTADAQNMKSREENANRVALSSSGAKPRQQHTSQSDKDSVRKTGGESRLTDFYNQQQKRNQHSSSADDLLERANVILRRTFKHESLRPLQQSAVRHALNRTSSIVIMATGGGKSMCYQLPALVAGGGGDNNGGMVRAESSCVTIVVCPLIALMVDQVNNLHRRGVHTAACLSSSHSAKIKQDTLNRLQVDRRESKNGVNKYGRDVTPIQLLYCTPELIETPRFRETLTKLYESNRLYMFAIDEAHCLSTWGHDFRPAFTKLTWVREAFPEVAVMACTGTATAKVVQDIRDILRLDKNAPCLIGTFNRENISYEVRFKDSLNATKPQGAISDLVDVVKKQHTNAKIKNQPCSGIIYVHKRQDCQALAAQISKATGLVCLPYHAGLKDSEREATQRKWTDGSCSIAVATVAFGMGIDLPHVRYVIHWTMAKSLEGFYQESGRGGRDGKPSLSILYYSREDSSKFAYLVKMNAEKSAKTKGKQSASKKADRCLVELEDMVNYCIKPICKRKYVLQHFGEKIDAGVVCKKTCDYCEDPKKVEMEIQASECMSVAVNSHRLMNAGRNKSQNERQKFHHNPLADDESLGDDYGSSDDFFGKDEGALGITHYAGQDEVASESRPKKGFVKASSVLKKYQTLEVQEGKKGGFVNFKARTFSEPTQDDLDTRRNRSVSMPAHLRNVMPDPLAAHKKDSVESAPVLKSSATYASNSERLKAELKELERQKASALAKMGGIVSSRSSSKNLSAPTLSFKKRRY